MVKTMRTVNGTRYHPETPDSMVQLLERLRDNQVRCRFHWGDVKTGKDWGDDCGVIGRIGRSTGRIKIPLLIYNSRSHGGGALLDHCIVRIVTTKGKKVLYQHPQYHK